MQPVLFLLLPAVIGVIVYLFIYFRTANARITGEYDPEKNSKMPAPSSALSVLWKIAVVVCFVILFVKLGDIADDISNTTANINNLNSRINSLNYNIEEQLKHALEQQNTLFTDYGYRVLSTDWDALQTEIEYYVVPKEISENASITLKLEEKDYPMENKGGEWTVRMYLNPFQNVDSNITATVTENGTIKNESWYADIHLSNKTKNVVSYIHSGTIKKGMITVSGGYEIILPSEIGVKNVILTVKNGDTVIRTATVPEKVSELFYEWSGSCFGAEVNDQITVKNGDAIVYALTWESENGLHGESEFFRMDITIEPNNTSVSESNSNYIKIFDKNGIRVN